jgi:predicted TIM-barrel enzyme
MGDDGDTADARPAAPPAPVLPPWVSAPALEGDVGLDPKYQRVARKTLRARAFSHVEDRPAFKALEWVPPTPRPQLVWPPHAHPLGGPAVVVPDLREYISAACVACAGWWAATAVP